MGSQQYRAELERKRKQRINAEKKVGEYRNKESKKRAEADKARQEAAKTKSASTQKSKLSRASRCDKEAASAGSEANKWQDKASGYRKQTSRPSLHEQSAPNLRQWSASASESRSWLSGVQPPNARQLKCD